MIKHYLIQLREAKPSCFENIGSEIDTLTLEQAKRIKRDYEKNGDGKCDIYVLKKIKYSKEK